eukprot:scaffold14530_cov69-Phaeocystis_antarctica.AAC.6
MAAAAAAPTPAALLAVPAVVGVSARLCPLLPLEKWQHEPGRHQADAAPHAARTERPSEACADTPRLVVEAVAAADRIQRALVENRGDTSVRHDGRQVPRVGDGETQPWRGVACASCVDRRATQVHGEHIGPAVGVQLSRQTGRAAAELEHGRGARQVRQVLVERCFEEAIVGH